MVFDIGYRLPNGQFVFWPRIRDFFPSPNDANASPRFGIGSYAGGVNVAPGGVMWAADFFGQRLVRLTPR